MIKKKMYEKKITKQEGRQKNQRGRLRTVLCYPNTYSLGMSNLGFQSVYQLINRQKNAYCERLFYRQGQLASNKAPLSVETSTRLNEFQIIFFSISFENDYINIVDMLDRAGLPLLAKDRGFPHPIIVAGGVTCFINPEPVAPIFDCILIGEAEILIPNFFSSFNHLIPKNEQLEKLARTVPGAYIPSLFTVKYKKNNTIDEFSPKINIPKPIQRVYENDLNRTETRSHFLSSDTIFADTFLIETGRGCPHGCRFCAAGYIYRPPRFYPKATIIDLMTYGREHTDRFGLVGAAVTDHPDISEICEDAVKKGIHLGLSSLRMNILTPALIATFKESKMKTITLAPEVGSERMLKIINKGIKLDDILRATEMIVSGGILNIKLYFMVGLPYEEIDDVDSIALLCKRVKEIFLSTSRSKGRMGEIIVSVNPFIPKPFTPFQWAGMDSIKVLKMKMSRIKKELKKSANVSVKIASPNQAFIQNLLSRGDRRVSEILINAYKNQGNWSKTLKSSVIDPHFYVTRDRDFQELLPWDFIDNGVKKSFLKNEAIKAKQEESSTSCPMKSCSVCGAC